MLVCDSKLCPCLMSAVSDGKTRRSHQSQYRCTCRRTARNSTAAPCVCPDTAPPGGLPPSQAPQFILFTVR